VLAAYVLCRDRQPEIGDTDRPSAVDHDIGRLQIAVQYTKSMGLGQSRAGLVCNLKRLVRRQPSDALQ
jgi:hypothetical protein